MTGRFSSTVIFICLLQVVAGCNVSPRISKHDLTATAIEAAFYRLERYVAQQHELPKSLDQLPSRKGYKDDIIDGWGRELYFELDEKDFVQIYSHGSDGMPGGSGSASDVELTFHINREQNGVKIVDVRRSWN